MTELEKLAQKNGITIQSQNNDEVAELRNQVAELQEALLLLLGGNTDDN